MFDSFRPVESIQSRIVFLGDSGVNRDHVVTCAYFLVLLSCLKNRTRVLLQHPPLTVKALLNFLVTNQHIGKENGFFEQTERL